MNSNEPKLLYYSIRTIRVQKTRAIAVIQITNLMNSIKTAQ